MIKDENMLYKERVSQPILVAAWPYVGQPADPIPHKKETPLQAGWEHPDLQRSNP